MVPSKGSSGEEPLAELLRRLQPDVERLLARFRIPEREAERILHEVMLVLTYRWDRIADKDAWLLATLHRRCQRWVEEGQRD
ncbi:MAG TPA: hypothetical protein VF121_18815 [Thermoanaerobaculia bacterium]|nr:hypothetical protein [Thermoanaerobaculia bacterium]